MIGIHAYLTDGFYEMARVFLISLATQNGNGLPVCLTTRGLTEDQVSGLRALYPGAMIDNEPIDFLGMSKRAGVPISVIKSYKETIERKYITNTSRVWKLMIAGDDRVKAVYNVLFNNTEVMFDGLVHFDIDTLFRGDISELLMMAREYDAALKLRSKHKVMKARITIDCMVLANNQRVKAWMEDWIRIIDSVPPLERPVGFGQSSCWLAFQMHEKRMNCVQLPLRYGLPGRNKLHDVIWCGNVHKLTKAECTMVFKNEHERLTSGGDNG